jgi:sugar phosphate isomerase/epimerase
VTRAHAPSQPSIGIFARTFDGRAPLDVLLQARDAGFNTVQYNMACSGLASLPAAVSPDVISAIRTATGASGVGIAALSATYNMIHPDTAVRAEGQASLTVLAATAQSLNIPLLTLCTGSRNALNPWAAHPDNGSAESWRDLLHSMTAALAIAERYDLMLGVEPEPSNVVASAAHAHQLITELAHARIGIVLDAANLLGPVLRESAETQRDVIERAIYQLGTRIVLVHAKDRRADGTFVAPGHGIVDFDACFQVLESAGVRAPVITHGLQSAEAADACRYLRARLRA